MTDEKEKQESSEIIEDSKATGEVEKKKIINIEEKIKEIVYRTYDNIFDFDIKSSSNGGDTLKVVVTIRTRLNQSIPIRVFIELNKYDGEYSIKRIYSTKYEKLSGLREKGSVEEFVSRFMDSEWDNSDVDKFIEDNEDIIEDQNTSLDREDIESLLKLTKERKMLK